MWRIVISNDILLFQVQNHNHDNRRKQKKTYTSHYFREIDSTLVHNDPFKKSGDRIYPLFLSGALERDTAPNPLLFPGRIRSKGLATKIEA